MVAYETWSHREVQLFFDYPIRSILRARRPFSGLANDDDDQDDDDDDLLPLSNWWLST